MASINTIVKRKQYLWLGIVVVGTASAIGGALYLSDVDMSGNGETVAEQEPVATPTTFLVNVNTLEALPLLQGATDAAGFMARMDTVLQMYGGKKGAK
ncbi:hypothetical protein GFB85_16345 [Escherichia coli]|nr:hypothetical protein [Escherichia coli]NBZ01643.1 hypothetical protein [Escherichia coli]NBZ04555.1 hypothetical protein [Escherichia coli]NBZ68095.1 hypothetical protein [Escherichia coli]NBZ77412.1 hypothetical protein [Escherichia coli]